ncbi:hypothetical protein IKB17_00280 [bacterium]|nr:hypothetical protein [bacterium]
MNITPINQISKDYSINAQRQNVLFQGLKGKTLVNNIKNSNGTIDPSVIDRFIKENFGRFSRKGVEDILKELLPYITELSAIAATLSAQNDKLSSQNDKLSTKNNKLEQETSTLKKENQNILVENKKLQIENDFLNKALAIPKMNSISNNGVEKAAKILDEMNIKYVIDENGLFIVDKFSVETLNAYKTLHPDFKYNDVTPFIKEIHQGDINCKKFERLKSKDRIDFSNLESVGGNVVYDYVNYELKISDGCWESGRVGVSMPNLKNVKGNFISLTTSKEGYDKPHLYPKNIETIDGNADIYPYVNLPKLTNIGGNADFNDAYCVYLPELKTIGGFINLEGAHDISLPNLESIKGNAFINGSKEAYNALGKCKDKASGGLPTAISVKV